MIDSTLNHLKLEITRIDLLIQKKIERWQLAGQNLTDEFRGLYVSDADVYRLLKRPFGTSWGQTVELAAQKEEAYQQAEEELCQKINSLVLKANQAGEPLRLALLKSRFGLHRFEYDTLLICLALSFDLRYERLFGFLQDDITRKEISVNLVLDLLCSSESERFFDLRYFSDDASLFHHHLLERRSGEPTLPLLKQTLATEPAIVAWLLGEYQPHANLAKHAILLKPKVTEENQLFAKIVCRNLEYIKSLETPLLVFSGLDSVSQLAAGELFAAQCKRPLLKVDLQGVIQLSSEVGKATISPQRALRLALRDARLTQAIPYFYGGDALLVNGTLPSTLLEELCAYPDTVIVAGQKNWLPQGIDRKRSLFYLAFPLPKYKQRADLWSYFLKQYVTSKELDIETLSAQFLLTTGQIRDAVAFAQDLAVQAERRVQSSDLFQAARHYSSPNLSGLADKIVPRFDWDDFILPEEQMCILKELVTTVRKRSLVLEEWGLGKKLVSSSGVTVLFAGPPGTGKTMAAEIIAGELEFDLYKIDLSRMVSKYIGETEKNLGRLFDEAANSSAILFFDEADAIFGKRSEVKDAHDRYANIEVSYLLQRMENFNGLTILATNLRANMDEAFTRRLQFAVNFPFPDKAERLRIWQTLLPATLPHKSDINFKLMADRFKLAGGSIRNIIVSAAYLAAADGQVLTMEHLAHATRRELQKMGRLISHVGLRPK
jgi:ATP-dependent 26S proteasome regulatory subunit